METPHLFMVSLGGSAQGANLELHDVQFVAAADVDEAVPLLRRRWFGDAKSLHLDGYRPVVWADGHAVTLRPAAAAAPLGLYFVHMGAYAEGTDGELHADGLFVAASAEEAKRRAKQSLLAGAEQQHADAVRAVAEVLLQAVPGWHLHLTPAPRPPALPPAWRGYRPIGA
ncbi:hypothetical protein GALL_155430 [mine drainage metagenome]|uniref:DUF1543 domain-containing protein n=1 Tax=mine drainage metagenome TaxID=410659 RepID=A0A1J5S1T5_9ZZZZ